MKDRLRAARTRAFLAYEAKYGERHRRDPRGPRPEVVIHSGDPALEAWVVDVIQAYNDGVTVIPPMP